MNYDLSHLSQDDTQAVFGPIQDDEALLLYATIRVCCYRRVIEFGGLHGYSARNFLAAVGRQGTVYTVELSPMTAVADNHKVINKQAKYVTPDDFDNAPVDLVFFDCHNERQQFIALDTLIAGNVVTPDTLLVFHDTGIHPEKFADWSERASDDSGYICMPVERDMVNVLRDRGYEAIPFDAPKPIPPLKFRHGLTLCRPAGRFAPPATPITQWPGMSE